MNTSPLTKPTALPTGLEKQLPGIGEATAKKIIAGALQTVGDLAKAGPHDTLEKITPMVAVGSAAPAETKKVGPAKAAKAAPRARTETVTARAPGHVR